MAARVFRISLLCAVAMVVVMSSNSHGFSHLQHPAGTGGTESEHESNENGHNSKSEEEQKTGGTTTAAPPKKEGSPTSKPDKSKNSTKEVADKLEAEKLNQTWECTKDIFIAKGVMSKDKLSAAEIKSAEKICDNKQESQQKESERKAKEGEAKTCDESVQDKEKPIAEKFQNASKKASDEKKYAINAAAATKDACIKKCESKQAEKQSNTSTKMPAGNTYNGSKWRRDAHSPCVAACQKTYDGAFANATQKENHAKSSAQSNYDQEYKASVGPIKANCDKKKDELEVAEKEEKKTKAAQQALERVEVARGKVTIANNTKPATQSGRKRDPKIEVPETLKTNKPVLPTKEEKRSYNKQIYPVIKEAMATQGAESAIVPADALALPDEFIVTANKLATLVTTNPELAPETADEVVDNNNNVQVVAKTLAQDGDAAFIYQMDFNECVQPTVFMVECLKFRDCCGRILEVCTDSVKIGAKSYSGEDDIPACNFEKDSVTYTTKAFHGSAAFAGQLNATNSPTSHPTSSPTKNPTSGPTSSPTGSPTYKKTSNCAQNADAEYLRLGVGRKPSELGCTWEDLCSNTITTGGCPAEGKFDWCKNEAGFMYFDAPKSDPQCSTRGVTIIGNDCYTCE